MCFKDELKHHIGELVILNSYVIKLFNDEFASSEENFAEYDFCNKAKHKIFILLDAGEFYLESRLHCEIAHYSSLSTIFQREIDSLAAICLMFSGKPTWIKVHREDLTIIQESRLCQE